MTRSPWRSRRLTAQPDLLEIDGLGSESPTIRSHPPRVLGGPSGQVIRLGDSRTSTRSLDADNYLASLRNFELTGFARRPTVDGARSLMESLGSPQRKLNAIHITGTNGKGSTANVSAALLAAMGHRVGLYTSPHLHKVNERISISGEPISDAALATALDRVRRAANSRWIYPTWFEALTAAALLHFTEVDVDAAVIEVGMLGRWDATNVIDAPVAVVTNVELDHVELAGPTRELIALEKSGIIRAGATLVLGERDPALLPVFEQQQPNRILLLDRDIRVIDRGHAQRGPSADLITPRSIHERIALKMAGGFQALNAALALAAVESLLDAPLAAEVVADVMSATAVPGRFETVGYSPTIVLDCAHNEAAALAVRPLIEQRLPSAHRRVLLVGLTARRDPLHFLLNMAADSFDHIVVTEPHTARAVPVGETALAAARLGRPVDVHREISAALQRAISLAGDDGLIVVIGSYYLVGPVRETLVRATTRGL